MRNIFLILLMIPVLISCGGQSNKSNDPVVYAEAKDPELEQAQKDALAKLDYFIKTFETNSNDTIFQFSLKVDFIENGAHEHMWISLNKIDNGQFQGYLGNEPELLKNIKFGDPVKINKDQIEDWIIVDTKNNKMDGGFSVKVLQKREKQQ